MLQIVIWNINGIRSIQPNLKDVFDSLDADIIALQETKITSKMYILVVSSHSSWCQPHFIILHFCTLNNALNKLCYNNTFLIHYVYRL